jgi:hypothetical protein
VEHEVILVVHHPLLVVLLWFLFESCDSRYPGFFGSSLGSPPLLWALPCGRRRTDDGIIFVRPPENK